MISYKVAELIIYLEPDCHILIIVWDLMIGNNP